MSETLADLASLVHADLVGDSGTRITGAAGLDTAIEGDIVFAENDLALEKAIACPATAIIVGPKTNGTSKPLLRADNPKYAFSRILQLFNPPRPIKPGVHNSAVVAESAQLGREVYIGPNAVVDEDTTIGDGCSIGAGCYIAHDVKIGANCFLHSNVTIHHQSVLGDRTVVHSGTVIGGDGFGYVNHGGKHEKLLQLGNVVIHDDVEIGSNTCIDRASFGSTVVGRGTKIDNQVQIGHNAEIGENCIIVSQVGISGSVKIGNFCILAGQVGIANHAILEDGVTIAAQSGIPSGKRVRAGQVYFGSPARKIEDFKKQWAALSQLPRQLGRFQELAEQVAELRIQKAAEDSAQE